MSAAAPEEAGFEARSWRMTEMHDGLNRVAVVIFSGGQHHAPQWLGPARTGPGSAYEVLTPGTGGQLTSSADPVPLAVPELVASIRASLSLNISQSAEVLGVQRPTLYAWMREEAEPQTANLSRLQLVAGLARRWNELSGRQPLGRRLRLPALGDQTVLDLLAEDPIRTIPLAEAFEHLARVEYERVPVGGRSARVQRRLGPRQHEEQEADLDVETGAGFVGETAAD